MAFQGTLAGQHRGRDAELARIEQAAHARDWPSAAPTDTVETLLLLTPQHNAKEENVLYPIEDRSLPDRLATPPDTHEDGTPWSS